MGFYRRRRKWLMLSLVLALTSAELVVAASSQGQEIDAVSPVEYGSFVDNQGIPVEESLNPSDRQRRSQPFQKQTTLPDVPQLPQSPRRNPIPSRRPVAIADIQVRFVDQAGQPTPGNTRPYIITREFDLEPGDVYRPEVAQQGLERVTELDSVEDATLSLQQTNQPNQIVMIVNVVEDSSFNVTAFPSASRAKGIYGVLRLEEENLGGNNQNLALELEGGEDTLGFEVSFTDPWIAGDPLRTGYSLAVFNQRSPSEVFIGGDRDVDLPNGETPWVHRLGGSGEVFRPLGGNWQAGVGLSYQRVSIRDQAFTDQVQPVDEFGNPLSLSDRGQDDLLTVNLSAVQDNRDDTDYPTQGTNVRVGMDQSVPVGEADIIFNRLSGSYTQYVPVELFGFTTGDQTLVFNLQGGTVIGDLPAYEAFSLGGGSSVRGYQSGEVGAGRSYLQATAEYRFPVFTWLGGRIFADYATDLGSGDTVTGEPGEVRDKPGSGLGYGVGVRVRSPFGPVQVDFGLNDQGDSQVHLGVGERF